MPASGQHSMGAGRLPPAHAFDGGRSEPVEDASTSSPVSTKAAAAESKAPVDRTEVGGTTSAACATGEPLVGDADDVRTGVSRLGRALHRRRLLADAIPRDAGLPGGGNGPTGFALGEDTARASARTAASSSETADWKSSSKTRDSFSAWVDDLLATPRHRDHPPSRDFHGWPHALHRDPATACELCANAVAWPTPRSFELRWTMASSELSAGVGDGRDDVHRGVPRAGGGDFQRSGHGGALAGGRQSPGGLVPELARLRTYESDGLTAPSSCWAPRSAGRTGSPRRGVAGHRPRHDVPDGRHLLEQPTAAGAVPARPPLGERDE